MVAGSIDPGIKFVLDNVGTVVASEGGSLEFLELRDGRLSVRYNKGRNDECPECEGHNLRNEGTACNDCDPKLDS